MTFVLIGSILLLIQLPLGWTAGYVLKTIGFVLCAAGLNELREPDSVQTEQNNDDPPVRENGLGGIAVWRAVCSRLPEGYDPGEILQARQSALGMLMKNSVVCAAAGAVCAAVAAVFEFIVNTAAAAYVTAATGAVMSLAAVRLVMGIAALMCESDRLIHKTKRTEFMLTDNLTDLLRLKDLFKKTSLCLLVNLICDIVNRAVPVETVQTFAGFMAFISKLTLYVFIITAAVRAYAVRAGYLRKHPVQNKHDG